MRSFLLSLFLIFWCFLAKSTIISGTVSDEKGGPLPYATITIKGTQQGITANGNGMFSFSLNPGTYTLVFEYVGYIPEEKKIRVSDQPLSFPIRLVTNPQFLEEVVVRSKGEDPAYGIIRQAIKKRDYYQNQIDSLSVHIYLKGILRSLAIPKKILGMKVSRSAEDGFDSIGKGVMLLSESNVIWDEVAPRKSKVTVLSSRSQGNDMGLSFSKVTSFYTNNVSVFESALNPRGYISPIADGALHYYRYKLLGSFQRNGATIKTIQVIPRRKNEPLFSGNIEIMEKSWRIYSLNLMLTSEYQLELIDTLRISQLHVAVTPEVWKTKTQIISVAFNQLGLKGNGHFVNVYSDYNLHPNFKAGYFNHILMQFEADYFKKDSAFWDTTRPISLQADEKKYYAHEDSMGLVRKNRTPAYYDSLRRNQKITVKKIFWGGQGYNWQDSNRTISYHLKGLLKGISFNTVEGLALNLEQHLSFSPKNGKYHYSLAIDSRYGFNNTHFNSFGQFTIRSKGNYFQTRRLEFAGGKAVSQFNADNPVNGLTNSFYSLVFKRNYLKIYENWFGQVNYYQRMENGLRFQLSMRWEDRMPLNNTTDFSFFFKDRTISSNHPEELHPISFKRHQAFVTRVMIGYQPGQRYIQYPNYKRSIGSHQPRFSLSYTKGIPEIFNSDVDYDTWSVEMSHDKNFKLRGKLLYHLGMGGFLNTKAYSIPDMKHFNGNRSFYNFKYLNSFQLAPYYAYSNVARFYMAGNLEHHFNGFLTNKLPLFNKLKWNLVAGSNAFYVNKNQYYAEGFVGLENIFKLFRVDFIAGYQPISATTYGVRIGLGGLLGAAMQAN